MFNLGGSQGLSQNWGRSHPLSGRLLLPICLESRPHRGGHRRRVVPWWSWTFGQLKCGTPASLCPPVKRGVAYWSLSEALSSSVLW